MSEKKLERDEKGRFLKGHKEGVGEAFASKYKEDYASLMVIWFEAEIGEGRHPTVEGFAKSIGVTSATVINWSEKFPHFLIAKKKCEDMQLNDLIQGGLTERYNPSFTKFVLSACHGMREKTESEVNMNANAEVGVRIEVVDSTK